MPTKKRSRPPLHAEPVESRTAEYLTAGWMLAVFTTLLCELGSAVAVVLRDAAGPLALLGAYLLFAALVIGLVSLLLTGVVLRIRSQAPPTAITVFALVVGAAPLVILLMQWLAG
jgi:hypothetical protein